MLPQLDNTTNKDRDVGRDLLNKRHYTPEKQMRDHSGKGWGWMRVEQLQNRAKEGATEDQNDYKVVNGQEKCDQVDRNCLLACELCLVQN